MRIIAGTAKGRRLAAPRSGGTRPFTSRMKESLFAVLGSVVEGSRVLDLYAGSGSLGLEALSRGAESATFVESARPALEALRRNIAAVGLGGTVVGEPVEAYLRRGGGPFDVVFVDPPYALGDDDLEAQLAALSRLVAEGGTVVVHRRAGTVLAPPPSTMLVVSDRRRYGGSEVWWLQKGAR